MKTVSVIIPVYNEEHRLPACIPKLTGFLAQRCPARWEVVIADNGSTDRTFSIAEGLGRDFPGVRGTFISQKGRGGAVKEAWLESASDILAYMDVDLSTDLEAFPALVSSIASEGFDLAIGSRFLPESRTVRCWKRELISRAYIGLIRRLCHVQLSDAQCGFKAITRKAARELLPLVEDNGWFFDTELLILAKRQGYRICELPVRWSEDRDSRVNILSTAIGDLKGLMRMRHNLA
jgi:glycosyltransferase involved in cell wall biosynthesis